MDRIISSYPKNLCGDLVLCYNHGVAYQHDMTQSVEYDIDYFNKYLSYEGTSISNELNKFRTYLVESHCSCALDVGIGSGEFIRNLRINAYGFDINPYGISWLKERGIFVDPYEDVPFTVDGVTFWDTLEHIKQPTALLDRFRKDVKVFISIPVFPNLDEIRSSKHYRPDEHYYYFTEQGLISYLGELGYELLESSRAEENAGRESIGSFVFVKNQ